MEIRKKVCYPNGTPRGRKRDMSPVGCLGLVLMWHRTTGACSRNLALHFGQTCTDLLAKPVSKRNIIHTLAITIRRR